MTQTNTSTDRRLTLKSALQVVQQPEHFLATYWALRDCPPLTGRGLDWLRKDGGKVTLERQGCLVRLTTYSYP